MRVDIAGAGIIGLSIAWRLAQAGYQVTIRDAGRVAGEASWAGAGMLAPGGEFRAESRWTRLAIESLAEYGAFVEELTLATGIPEAVCRRINLGYRDPRTIRLEAFANREQEGVLLVPKAGEMLYRLKNPPAWQAGG